MLNTNDILSAAKVTSLNAALPLEIRNEALKLMAEELVNNTDSILSANALDIQKARGNVNDVMLDRLMLNADRVKAMADGILDLVKLPDPLFRELDNYNRADGLKIKKVSVPIGVVAIIYESRPNVTSDAAALCFKSGNVAVLRGGKEAYNTSRVIVDVLQNALLRLGIDKNYIQLIDDITRQSATDIMTAVGLVDLLIPRGGKGLISACVQNAKVPCIETGTGICHIYVDKDADLEKALNIAENAKASRPSVCNAAEVCLVNKEIASEFLPKLYERFTSDYKYHKVAIKGDKTVSEIISCEVATEKDFDTEFLDYIMAVKVVDGVKDAVKHILKHSTHHSEAIITENKDTADYFTANVDSAAVYVNASTRFTDGGEFGLGCEMGISTQKIHARGPMGLNELTSYKYIIVGDGNVR